MNLGPALRVVATYPISQGKILLHVARGSVVAFRGDERSAIVNAANDGCLGGGGVDGAISMAGGPMLAEDRVKLPCVKPGIRCPTGQAVTTGPGDYGELSVPFVIHAVGPNYYSYSSNDEPDELLHSAYQTAMDECQKHEISKVAFSLLSAGVFRGSRSLQEVLTIGIKSISSWVKEAKEGSDTIYPQEVTLCGFTERETMTLIDICDAEFSLED